MASEGLQGHRARKRFGQNFLHDRHWNERIAKAVNATEGDDIVEIGPGQAALTRELIAGAGKVRAVEIDRDLAAWLKETFPESLRLIEADALTLDWTQVAKNDNLRVVGNLPYNISSPLLFKLLEAADHVKDQHFMLQKEVVDRMVAQHGSKTYGRLSVMLQWRYRMQKLFDVPPGAFNPPPKVMSSVVRMIPICPPGAKGRSSRTQSRHTRYHGRLNRACVSAEGLSYYRDKPSFFSAECEHCVQYSLWKDFHYGSHQSAVSLRCRRQLSASQNRGAGPRQIFLRPDQQGRTHSH